MRRNSNNRTVNPDRIRYFYIRELVRQTTPFGSLKFLRPNYLHRIGVIALEHLLDGRVKIAISLCAKTDKFDPLFAISSVQAKLERNALTIPFGALENHSFHSLLGALTFDNPLIDERLANVPTTMHNRALKRIIEDFKLQKLTVAMQPAVVKPIVLAATATKSVTKRIVKKVSVHKKSGASKSKARKTVIRSRK